MSAQREQLIPQLIHVSPYDSSPNLRDEIEGINLVGNPESVLSAH